MTGATEFSASTVAQLLDDTRRALETMRGGQAAPAPAPITGEGESADRRVRAVAATPGRLESLTLDPRLLRAGSDAVGEAVLEAVNHALADLRAKATSGVGAPVDLDQLGGELQEVQTRSLQSMQAMFDTLHDVMDRIDRRT
ncbi:YbaB/EbfC family nucleoid-associated protein [Actinopolymorpha pittospori]